MQLCFRTLDICGQFLVLFFCFAPNLLLFILMMRKKVTSSEREEAEAEAQCWHFLMMHINLGSNNLKTLQPITNSLRRFCHANLSHRLSGQ